MRDFINYNSVLVVAIGVIVIATNATKEPPMPVVLAAPIDSVEIVEVLPIATREIVAPVPIAAPIQVVEIESLGEPFALAKVNYSEEQEFCLAQNIYFESRDQIVEGMVAVAIVTMNRAASKRYPNTICKVVWQRKQFSWTHDGKSDKPNEPLAWKIAQDVAASVLKNYTSTDYDFTDGAMWYHADYVTPSWSKKLNQTATIGAHLFYAKG